MKVTAYNTIKPIFAFQRKPDWLINDLYHGDHILNRLSLRELADVIENEHKPAWNWLCKQLISRNAKYLTHCYDLPDIVKIVVFDQDLALEFKLRFC